MGMICAILTGFVRGRSGVTNIRKVLLALEYARANPKEDAVMVSLYAEKAFDNISWQWLFLTLNKLGFRGQILEFLERMYAHPRARIDTGLQLSASFSLSKGTRQGCPLSPLLFNLALEPLARQILLSSDIQGIPISPSHSFKLAMFADDILLFSDAPETDLLRLQELLIKFKAMSGLRINFVKSQILKMTHIKSRNWLQKSPLTVAPASIKYLGIHIGDTPESIYSLNYPPLVAHIERIGDVEGPPSVPFRADIPL